DGRPLARLALELGPAARAIAAATPPPWRSSVLAAFATASTSSAVTSARLTSISGTPRMLTSSRSGGTEVLSGWPSAEDAHGCARRRLTPRAVPRDDRQRGVHQPAAVDRPPRGLRRSPAELKPQPKGLSPGQRPRLAPELEQPFRAWDRDRPGGRDDAVLAARDPKVQRAVRAELLRPGTRQGELRRQGLDRTRLEGPVDEHVDLAPAGGQIQVPAGVLTERVDALAGEA